MFGAPPGPPAHPAGPPAPAMAPRPGLAPAPAPGVPVKSPNAAFAEALAAAVTSIKSAAVAAKAAGERAVEADDDVVDGPTENAITTGVAALEKMAQEWEDLSTDINDKAAAESHPPGPGGPAGAPPAAGHAPPAFGR